ncbi:MULTISPECIES: DUF2267 domain-containing protein [Mameliella]|uniref:DUF2267 domain-containing protein n=1 Tax=Mameliella TaxID=1434019 RepID=UPI000B532BA9|nr:MULTISPECIES: DUF2267 domain-containing protein [Mameliella]MCR9275214.1 DUF2267 domain-containing protein [Paracoccaceae bacterium]OWV59092.1 hypothetical protein CDZ98_12325 [Mameliella alba]
MPQPWTYRHASREYRAFLDDLKARMNLESDNMAYTALDGVFHVFRRRVTAEEGLRFASVLPSVPRAIFVAGWQPEVPPAPWASRDDLIREAQALRPNHNLTPDTCIEAVAWALRRAIRGPEWECALAALPPEARAFWRVEVADPSELEPGIR